MFAKFFHVNGADANMAAIPENVPDDGAVYCADMLSTGFMGAEDGNIPVGGTVAVLAQGPVGLMATAGARLRGAGLVVGVESVPKRQGGTVSDTGYFGEGEFVHIPRVDWGLGMADKTITTGLCPGGRLRMERLLRVLETKRVDPTLMTTHTFPFDDMERAFEVSDKEPDDVIKPPIVF